MNEVDLRLDWASHAAAKHACETWHYSRSVPAGKLVKIGVWESGRFIGVVMFGRGASINLGTKYGLGQDQVAELVRIALRDHITPVSRIMAIAIRMFAKAQPGIRLIVSFADPMQGHVGGVYQAAGWVYSGETESQQGKFFVVHGVRRHGKSLHSIYGVGGQRLEWLRANVDPNATVAPSIPKHRYLMPLDAAMKRQVATLAKPYPKRAK